MRRVFTQLTTFLVLSLIHVQAAFAAGDAHGEVAGHGDVHHEASGGLPQLNPESFPSQIFWLAVTFLVMYLIFAKKTLPEISGVIENRKERVQGDLSEAEKLKSEAENVQQAYEEALEGAHNEASAAFTEVETGIKADSAEALNKFREQSNSELQKAEKKVEKATKAAMKDMDTIAAEIAAQAAEKIVGISTDIDQAKSVIENINKKAA